MATATITSKGQITIPAPVRMDLHVGPGDRIEFAEAVAEILEARDERAVKIRFTLSTPHVKAPELPEKVDPDD